jgi:hypothetical protein
MDIEKVSRNFLFNEDRAGEKPHLCLLDDVFSKIS